MNLIDCHTHTSNSFDGHGSVRERILRAEQIGLNALGISEHFETNRFFSQAYYGAASHHVHDMFNFVEIFEKSMSDNTAAIAEYDGNVTVLSGIELGEPYVNYHLAEVLIEDKRLDFVIASAHELPGKADFAFLDYTEENTEKYLNLYFDLVYDMCCWGKFDILGHLTYPLRYIEGEKGLRFDIKKYEGIIAEILRKLAEKGLAIEINTSGLRQKYGKPFPTLDYIKLYREFGGEFISLGSDAHSDADLGKHLEYGAEMVKTAGFDSVCIFKKRKPEFIKI